jgi:hypothetical protein
MSPTTKKIRNPAAVALGPARVARFSREKHSELARIAVKARWNKAK